MDKIGTDQLIMIPQDGEQEEIIQSKYVPNKLNYK